METGTEGRVIGRFLAAADGRLYADGQEITHLRDEDGSTLELGPAQRDLLAVLVAIGPAPASFESLAGRFRKRRATENAVESCRLAWKRLRRFLLLLDPGLEAAVIHPKGRRGLVGLRFGAGPGVESTPTPPPVELPPAASLFSRSPVPTYISRCLPLDPRPEKMPLVWANDAFLYLARWETWTGRTVEDVIERLSQGSPAGAAEQVRVLDEAAAPPPDISGDCFQFGPVVMDRGLLGKRSSERWSEPLRVIAIAHFVRDGRGERTHSVVQYVVTPTKADVPLGAHDTRPWFRAVDGPLRALARLDEVRDTGQLDAAAYFVARRQVLEGRAVLAER